PPAYTRQNPDTSSQPVLRVLKGTYIQLTLSVESARMYRLFSPSLPLEKAYPTHSWKGTFLALSSSSHTLYVQDSLFQDSLTLRVEVYPDYYPSVQLFSEWFNPETWEQGIRLRLMDDFGFSKGVLWYRIVEGATPARAQEKYQALPLAISSDATQERLMTLSWPSMGIQPGDKVEYFVEVWDNDLISGPKASRSIAYTLEPLDEPAKQEIFADLQDSLFRELLSVQRALEKLLLEKEDLQKAQRSTTALSEKFRSLRSELRSLQRLAAEQQLYTPELLEQVRQLQKLLDAMDPQKPEQLLSQLLQQQTDSAKAAQLQEELERAYREWQEKMARFEALLPAYQQQRRLEELMTRLSEMAESEKRLSTLPDSLQHQPAAQSLQQRLLQDTRQLSRQVDSLRGLASPSPLQDSMEKALQHLQDAMHSMQKALQEMQRTEGKPQEDQKRAAEALEQALSTMDGGAQQEQADEEAEAYEALRLLLKGILSLSFRQEAVRKKTQESASFTGIAQTIIRDQNAIRRDYQQIHDSLFALANRSPVLEEALLDLLRDLEKYFQGLTFYQSELLLRRQQYILQGLNRLANLMTELLAQLEENQRNRQAGGGACQRSFKVRRKGATGRPSPSKNSAQGQSPTPQSTPRQGPIPSLQQLQHQLNESLQRALTPNPASENPGGTLSPEERARLSAQQELIRLRLQEWLQQHPGDAGQLQNLIEEMQKAEKDILGGALTRERLLRQQQILTRLLDYERSQQERELEPTRESRTARQFFERTTGIYPLPTLPLPPAPALRTTWIYQPSYQNLIERYFYHP
ncbi:MAG: hypothetical protein N2170_00840, partial [Bacteroidia bacterium]|nr:hypothetical protein [Bacteroidia bacterium]